MPLVDEQGIQFIHGCRMQHDGVLLKDRSDVVKNVDQFPHLGAVVLAGQSPQQLVACVYHGSEEIACILLTPIPPGYPLVDIDAPIRHDVPFSLEFNQLLDGQWITDDSGVAQAAMPIIQSGMQSAIHGGLGVNVAS